MTFVNIYKDNNCLAEVCGEVSVTAKTCTITVDPTQRAQALMIVNQIKGASYLLNAITVPIECIKYMANGDYTVKSIRLLSKVA